MIEHKKQEEIIEIQEVIMTQLEGYTLFDLLVLQDSVDKVLKKRGY